ncbi:DUF2523 family protein [Paraglaciecola sp.]|uniref:DUF2523 family protein n=1 Tax=Paraglaciecola sp. TaxID=1920173 RepID=UPI0030F3DC32
MKIILFLIALSFAPVASAVTFGDAISFFTGLGEDFWSLVTIETPSMIERFFAWVLEIMVVWKFQALLSSTKLAWSVAAVILADMQLGSQLNSLIGFLPNDVQAAMVQLRIMDAIELIIQALVARFALDMVQ